MGAVTSYSGYQLLFSDNALTTLGGPITNTALSLTVASGSGVLFPNPSAGQAFVLSLTDALTRLVTEIVLVTAVSGDTFTIVRAQENTTAEAWNAGDIAWNGVTGGQMATMQQQGGAPAGQCRLSVTSPTALELLPFAGNVITINGQNQIVPSGGVTVSNAGLAANTVYNVYASVPSGSMVLTCSTIGHSTDPITGQQIQTGNAALTLVGKIRTDASVHFNDLTALRTCINWFNQQSSNASGTPITNSTSNTSYVDMTSTGQCQFLAWGNNAFFVVATGFGANSTAGSGGSITLSLDTVTGFSSNSGFTSVSANTNQAVLSSASLTPTEGFHTLGFSGLTVGGGVITVTVDLQTLIRS